VPFLNRRRLPNGGKLNAVVAGERGAVIVLPQPDRERDTAWKGRASSLAAGVKMPTVSANLAEYWKIYLGII